MNALIKSFLDAKIVESGASESTVEAYRRDLCQLEEFAAPQELSSLQIEDLEKYLAYLKENGSRSKTVSRKISCIREFYKFLQNERIITKNPSIKLKNPKIEKRLPEFLLPEEIGRLCVAANCGQNFSLMRMGVMIRLMYSTGLRVSELVSLPENAINYDLSQIIILGKGSKERIVPITKSVAKEVLLYSEYRKEFIGSRKNKWLFPSIRSQSGHITRDGFFKNLKKIAVLAGISPEKVHPHVLRHSFATKLINSNVDLRSIQKLLGHEHIATTEIYTHITTENLIKEVRSKHPLMRKESEK